MAQEIITVEFVGFSSTLLHNTPHNTEKQEISAGFCKFNSKTNSKTFFFFSIVTLFFFFFPVPIV